MVSIVRVGESTRGPVVGELEGKGKGCWRWIEREAIRERSQCREVQRITSGRVKRLFVHTRGGNYWRRWGGRSSDIRVDGGNGGRSKGFWEGKDDIIKLDIAMHDLL